MSSISLKRSPAKSVIPEPAARPQKSVLKALYILEAESLDVIYGPEEKRDLEMMVEFCGKPETGESIRKNLGVLENVEVIFSGWGGPIMDEEFLAAAPKLRGFFYGAGSIRRMTTEAFWRRGIAITSAYAANAVPVAEYTLGVILLSLKNFWSYARRTRNGEGWDGAHRRDVPGAFGSTVGFISCGMIVRRLLPMLGSFDMHRLISCPFLSEEEAVQLGAQHCSLDDIFRRSDVVSLHTPELPVTRGMITGAHFSAMKKGATFINSARGSVVRQDEMIEVLKRRPDLTAILDVCDPEPPAADSPLLTLPNVILTPHIAGSVGPECRRLGRYMVDELRRFIAGEPMRWQISEELASKLA